VSTTLAVNAAIGDVMCTMMLQQLTLMLKLRLDS